MWGVIDAQYNGWRCLVRKGARPTGDRDPDTVPGCTIDAGSLSLRLMVRPSPAVTRPRKRECPFLPSAAGDTYQFRTA
jgi:hypothetical protein